MVILNKAQRTLVLDAPICVQSPTIIAEYEVASTYHSSELRRMTSRTENVLPTTTDERTLSAASKCPRLFFLSRSHRHAECWGQSRETARTRFGKVEKTIS